MTVALPEPVMRPIADTAVLVEFGDVIDDTIHDRVLDFDAAVQAAELPGVTELIPAYTTVQVGYDPLLTDYEILCAALSQYFQARRSSATEPHHWQIPVCYAEKFAPDLAEIAEQLNMSQQEVTERHASSRYKVYMYGFAPGMAYMGGVPKDIQVPRKQAPVMGIPTRSVMVAGPQSLIYTMEMPSGWWRIGKSGINPLQTQSQRPFLFDVGDTVEFVAMSEADFAKHEIR